MKLIKKIYLSNLAYLILPLFIITLAIYVVGTNGYRQIIHERNLLQLNHLVQMFEDEIDLFQNGQRVLKEPYLADGSLFLYDNHYDVMMGEDITGQISVDRLKELPLHNFRQGSYVDGFYVYLTTIPNTTFNLIYLKKKRLVNAPIVKFKVFLIIWFISLVCLFLFLQQRTNAKLVRPIDRLYSMVWNMMDANSKINSHQFDEDELKVVEKYITRLEQSVQERDSKLRRNLFSVMDVLISLLEIKDSYTAFHSRQVRKFSIAIAQMMGMDEQEIRDIAFAATLHDIGKIGVSRTILNKPGKLTTTEFSTIKQHPIVADDVLKNIEELGSIRKIIRHHHEKYDGTGYPDNLRAQDIPLAARIISVADAFDAMTSDRPYRKALNYQQAVKILKSEQGRQFDPIVVNALLQYLLQQDLFEDFVAVNS